VALLLAVSLLLLVSGSIFRRWWPEARVTEAGALGIFAWFLYQLRQATKRYRCPLCGDRLKERIFINSRAPGDREDGGPVHYVCPRCDVEWDTGHEWSSRGD
jgi:DNA-directed RNA polymerase subunit RPC12/RpoP